MPTARGWSDGRTPDGRAGAQGQRLRRRTSSIRAGSTCCPMATCWSPRRCRCPAASRSAFDYAMFSTMQRAGGDRRQPQPHHAAARRRRRRRRRDPRDLPRRAEPALRHGAARRHLLCRQHRRRRWPSPMRTAPTRITGARPAASSTFKPGGHWTRNLLASPDGTKLYVGVGSLTNIADEGMEAEEGRAGIYELDLATGTAPHLRRGPAQPGRPRLGAVDRRALDRRQRARRARRRDAARLPDLGQGRRLLWLALLLLGPDGRRPGAAGSGAGRHGRSARTTRWAATPPRSASAGCPKAPCPASRTGMVDRPARLLEPLQAQRLQGRLRALRRTAGPPARCATSSPASSRPTRRSPTAARSVSRSARTARCWSPTTSATSSGVSPGHDLRVSSA